MKDKLVYTFVESDYTKAIIIIKPANKSLVYATLGNNKSSLLQKANIYLQKLAKREKYACALQDELKLSDTDSQIVKEVRSQFLDVLNQENTRPDIKFEFLGGTQFQRKVWIELSKIKFGEVLTYSNIAKNIGHPKAVRAVGKACGDNNIIIVIPCHRVMGSNGQLTGFALGCEMKKTLLEREKVRRLNLAKQNIS